MAENGECPGRTQAVAEANNDEPAPAGFGIGAPSARGGRPPGLPPICIGQSSPPPIDSDPDTLATAFPDALPSAGVDTVDGEGNASGYDHTPKGKPGTSSTHSTARWQASGGSGGSGGSGRCNASEHATDNFDPDVLRSVSLCRTLSRAGHCWRVRPSTHAGQLRMFALSQIATSIDYFLSHSWASSGRTKYLSLLLRFHWFGGAAAAVLSLAVVFNLTVFEYLPELISYEYSSQVGDYHTSIPMGCWCSLISPVLTLLGLILSPAISQILRVPGPQVFLDQVCINQVDPVKKQEGILALGWFLRHSKTLVVLWTPHYFSRLWCVFEFAAFMKVNRHRGAKVLFQPMFMELFFYGHFGIMWIGILVLVKVRLHFWGFGLLPGIFLPVFLPVSLVMGRFRTFVRQKRILDTQLANFDCMEANCYLSSDKEFIHERVRTWYGSLDNFNHTVRTDMRAYFKTTLRADKLGYRVALAGSWPFVCFCFDFLAGLIRGSAPTVVIMNYALFLMGGFLFFHPAYVRFFFIVVMKVSRQRQTRVAETVVNVASSLLVALVYMIGIGSWVVIYKRNAVFNVVLTVLWAGIAVYMFLVRRLVH